MQKVSQFLDDELPEEEALRLLQKMRTHSELAGKMRRYEAIKQAIKNDEELISATPDFAASVSSRIQQEPAYLIPNATRRWSRHRSFTRSHKIAALAASVAVIAFVAHTQRPEPASPVQVAAVKAPDKPAPQLAETKTPRNSYPVNQQISDYLQAHSSIYTNSQSDFQPYAKLTHYSQK
ncbi:sigma-E factor negative regulatory protein [Methylomicrobium lacus]|uniref:sigma-E factor negative regulatory protein n=1 Tax=Methylomicrobium lacus TaxID=136992 RepID=UPI0035A986D9